MAVDEAVLDYDPIGEFEQDDRKMLRMLLVAAQRQMVDTVVSAADRREARAGGPRPGALRDGALGGHDRASAWTSRTRVTRRCIDIGAHVTNIVVHARGTVRFVRILPSGGRDMTARDRPRHRRRGRRRRASEAGRGGRARGRRVDGGRTRLPSVPTRAGSEIAMQRAGELRRRDPLVARVLHGPGAGRPHRARAGHRRRLEARGVPRAAASAHPGRRSSAGQVFQHARSQLSLSEEAPGRGRARARRRRRARDPREGGVSQVNLLPPDILQAQRYRRRTAAVAPAGAVLLVAIFGFYLVQTGRLSSVQRRDRRPGGHEHVDPGLASPRSSGSPTCRPRRRRSSSCCAAAYAGEVSFSALLMDVSRVIPSDAYLDNLTVQVTEPAAATGRDHAHQPRGLDHRERPGREHRHPVGLPHAARAGQGLGEPVDADGLQQRAGGRLPVLGQRRPHRRGRHRAGQGSGDRWRGRRGPFIAGGVALAPRRSSWCSSSCSRRWGRSPTPTTSSRRPRRSRARSSPSSRRWSRRRRPRPRPRRRSRTWSARSRRRPTKPGLLLLVKNAAAELGRHVDDDDAGQPRRSTRRRASRASPSRSRPKAATSR